MSKTGKFFSLALCVTFATAFIAFAFVALFAFCYSVYAPNILKNKINQASGFYARADKVTYNALTGNMTAYNVNIDNPRSYAVSDFLSAREVKLRLNPIKFIFGKIEIYRALFDIENLKCVILSPTKNNISDFLTSDIASFSNGKFENIKIDATNLSFSDISDMDNRFERDFNQPLKIEIKDASDKSELKKRVENAFKEADALFIYTNITQFRD